MNGPEGSSIPQPMLPRTLRFGDLVVFIFGLAAFLPYLKSSPLGSDVQPHYYAFLPFVLLLFFRFNPAKTLVTLYCLLLLGLGVYLKMSPLELIAFTAVCSAINLLPGLDEQQRKVLCWAVRTAMALYLLAAVLDLIGGSSVLSKIVANRRRTAGRGLCSLASEPSFLGFAGLAGFIVLRKSNNAKLRIFDATVPFLVIFSSGSMAAVAPAVVVAFAGSLKSIRSIVISAVSFVVLLSVAFAVFPNSRFIQLAEQFQESPAEALEESSGANRIFRGVGPSYYAFKTGLMPHSPEELDQIYRKMKFLREDVRITKISNLGGMMFFVYGVMALPLIIGYAFQFRGAKVNEIAFAVAAIAAFSFSLVATSTPFMHFVVGSLLWRPKDSVDFDNADAESSLSTPLSS